MNLIKIIKAIVIILALIMFGVQFRIAILNLIDPPMVDSSYERELTADDMPVITICPYNQTNSAMEKALFRLKFGTQMEDLLQGSAKCEENTQCNSWGSHVNQTYDQVLKEVFNPNVISKIFTWALNKDEKEVFLPMIGLCKEISNYIDVQDIVKMNIMETETRIFFTNQKTRSYFMPDLSSHIGDKLALWPTQTTFVHVKVEVKSSCRQHEVPWTVEDYNKCINDQLHGIFSGNFNCTPPWLSTHNQCDGIYSRKYFNNNPTFSKQIVLPLLNFGNNKIEADCRKSCETKHYHVDVRGETSKGSKHHAYITVDQKVSVTEKVANYSPFQSFRCWIQPWSLVRSLCAWYT